MDNNKEKLNFELESENLDEEFNNACAQLKVLNLNLDNDTKLQFYGLFKEATVGKSTENKKSVSFFDFEEKYKIEAWKKCDIFSMQEAKKHYIELFKSVATNSVGSQSDKDSSIKDFQNSAFYSSTAGETKKEIETHFNSLQDNGKKFFLLSNKFYRGDEITVEILKNEQIDLMTSRDDIGQTILHTAVDSTNLSAVKALVETGIAEKLINVQDSHGMTAMHIASINYDEPIFAILAKLNPNKNFKDEDDKTFLDYLQENEEENFEKIVKLF